MVAAKRHSVPRRGRARDSGTHYRTAGPAVGPRSMRRPPRTTALPTSGDRGQRRPCVAASSGKIAGSRSCAVRSTSGAGLVSRGKWRTWRAAFPGQRAGSHGHWPDDLLRTGRAGRQAVGAGGTAMVVIGPTPRPTGLRTWRTSLAGRRGGRRRWRTGSAMDQEPAGRQPALSQSGRLATRHGNGIGAALGYSAQGLDWAAGRSTKCSACAESESGPAGWRYDMTGRCRRDQRDPSSKNRAMIARLMA